MKRNLLLFCLAITLALPGKVFAQISRGGTPKSFEIEQAKSLNAVPSKRLERIDFNRLYVEDQLNDARKDTPWRYGYGFDVSYNPNNSGTWDYLQDGGKIWRLAISSPGALSMDIFFNIFHLPLGAELFIYSWDRTHTIGAFTSLNNHDTKTLATSFVFSNHVIVEYYQPGKAEFEGEINIGRITHGYRSVTDFTKGFGGAGYCNVNVSCPEAAELANQARSVLLLATSNGPNSYLCTGTLLNNTANNGRPYVFSSNKMYSNPAKAFFIFNWQSELCENPTEIPSYQTLSGATDRARNDGTNFWLVELNNIPPEDYEPYYAGWNRTVNEYITEKVWAIHHPKGDIKKVSWANEGVSTTSYGNVGVPGYGTHWRVTSWSDGTATEAGSMGAPLFDNNGRVLGHLDGGQSACGNTESDWFGRLGKSWTGGETDTRRLSNWLDPLNTGAMAIDGFDPYSYTCTPPTEPATNFTYSQAEDHTLTISWNRGNGEKVLVVARMIGDVTSIPLNGISYESNETFGLGSHIAIGDYVVYNGTETNVTISNLRPGTRYYFAIYEYFAEENCYIQTPLRGSAKTTNTETCSYCIPTANDNDETGVAHVSFNSITNSSNTLSAYSDYTAISTVVRKGESYPLSVKVNTGGNFTATTSVWFDWDKDCEFNSDEAYMLGTATNTTNGLTSLSPRTIKIPDNAVEGPTTMRVRTKYDSGLLTPCGNQNYSEAEDYTIIIVAATNPEITVSKVKLNFEKVMTEEVSEEQTYNVSGLRLYSDVTISAPEGFEISTQSDAGYSSTIRLSHTDGTIPNTPVYVRFAPNASGEYSGNITHETDEGDIKIIEVSGNSYTLLPPRNLMGEIEENNNVTLSWLSPEMDEGFEHYEDFSLNFGSWLQFDMDQDQTYGINLHEFPNQHYTGSFILFTPSLTTPSLSKDTWGPHSGEKMIACFAAIDSVNNDWLVSPKISIQQGDVLRFWAKSISPLRIERIRVGISTSGSNPNDFTMVSTEPFIPVPATWTEFQFPLDEYVGENIHFTINCVSDDAFVLAIDDITISNAKGLNSFTETFEKSHQTDEIFSRVEPHKPIKIKDEAKSKSFSTYTVYRDGIEIGTTDELFYTDTDLPAENYHYSVRANYLNPNKLSPPSNTIQIHFLHTVSYAVVGENGVLEANANGIAINSGDNVPKGSSIEFTAIPNVGFQVKNWHLNNELITNETDIAYTLYDISDDIFVTVEFEPIPLPTFPVTFEVMGGNGTLAALVGGVPIASGDAVEQWQDVAFSAQPDPEYQIARWVLNGQTLPGQDNHYTLTHIDAPTHVTVEFEPIPLPTFPVTFEVIGGNGTLTASVDGVPIASGEAVEQGQDVVFTAQSDPEYRIAQWVLNGQPLPEQDNHYTLTHIDAPAHVTVEFEPIPLPTFPVTFEVIDGNGTLAASVGGTPIANGDAIEQGQDVVFTAQPNPEYRIAQWVLNGQTLPGQEAQYTLTHIDAPAHITVEFEPIPLPTFPVTFGVVGGNGTLAASVNGTSIVSGDTVELGQNVTFSAQPDPEYQIAQWVLNGQPLPEQDNHYTLTHIDAPAHVTVEFEPVEYLLTIEVNGNGTTTPSVGNHLFPYGTTVVLQAFPNEGHEFIKWAIEDEEVTIHDYEITINGNITATAYFSPINTIDYGNAIVSVFPNPTNGIVWVKTAENSTVFVSDITGTPIKIQQNITSFVSHAIDLSSYTPGVYFVRVESKTVTKIYRIIKL